MASEPRGGSLPEVTSTATFSFNDPPYLTPSRGTSCVQNCTRLTDASQAVRVLLDL